jgi:hypothetical protein
MMGDIVKKALFTIHYKIENLTLATRRQKRYYLSMIFLRLFHTDAVFADQRRSKTPELAARDGLKCLRL